MWKCKEWWNNHLILGIWCGPLSQHALPLARHQLHLLIPSAQNNQPGKNKESRNEIQLSTNRIVLPWPTHIEPRCKRGSAKINMHEQGRSTKKKASRIAQPGLTYGTQHLERWTWNPGLREEQIGPGP